MNMLCDKRNLCPDDPNPVIGLVSSAPDVVKIYVYGSSNPGSQPPGPGWNDNPNCQQRNGIAACASETQEEAAACLARIQLLCDPSSPPSPGNEVGKLCLGPECIPSTVYGNTPQFCGVQCPDGPLYIYTVPAMTFLASSQELADQMAHSFACYKAHDHPPCPTPPSCTITSDPSLPDGSTGSYYSEQIASDISITSWEIADGALPDGLSLDPATGIISGTPTTPGTYTFTVSASGTGSAAIIDLNQPTPPIPTPAPNPPPPPSATINRTLLGFEIDAINLTMGKRYSISYESNPSGMQWGQATLPTFTATGPNYHYEEPTAYWNYPFAVVKNAVITEVP